MNFVLPIVALTIGTYALRLMGPALRRRTTISAHLEHVMSTAVAIIFVALVATSALLVGHDFAGFACPAGVAVAGTLAWRKAPFVLIVVAAMLTTAVLRSAGIS